MTLTVIQVLTAGQPQHLALLTKVYDLPRALRSGSKNPFSLRDVSSDSRQTCLLSCRTRSTTVCHKCSSQTVVSAHRLLGIGLKLTLTIVTLKTRYLTIIIIIIIYYIGFQSVETNLGILTLIGTSYKRQIP